nr:hypothetical protein [uncultured Methanospirillum sp.]
MGVKITDLPQLHILTASAIQVDENGDVIWDNGKKPLTKSEAIKQILERLKTNLKNWDHEKISTLYATLSDIEKAGHPERLQDLVELSRLPTEPIPTGLERYPIWALDKKGCCLVGSGQINIKSLSDVHSWFVTRKPGYCTKPDIKGCYLCELTKSKRDCRNNQIFYPL